MTTETATVPLNGGFTITWNKRAEYKLGKLKEPPKFEDLQRDDHRFFSALCDFLWAMQVAPEKFKTPEEIADHLNHENLPQVVKCLVDCIVGKQPDAEKKSSSSNGPSPESS